VVKNGKAARYKLTWGSESKSYTGAQLGKGVNLAADFPLNPFSEAFAKVDAAVATKQEYETRQIKTMFHGPEAKVDMKSLEELTERVRTPLAAAIKTAFIPVIHTLSLAAE
jgi:hypothetical protein